MKFRIKLPEIEFEISKQFKFVVGRYWNYIFIYFGCLTLRIGKLL